MNIRHLNIHQKLILSFSSVVIFLLILAALTYIRVTSLSGEINLTNNNRYPATVMAHSIKDELNVTALTMYNILMISDADDLKKEYLNFEKRSDTILKALEKLKQFNTGKGLDTQLQALASVQQKFGKYQTEFIGLSKQGRNEEAKTLLQYVIHPVHQTYMKEIDQLIQNQSKQMETAGIDANDSATRTGFLILLIASVATVAAIIMATKTIRSITRPLNRAVEIARKVADADLTSSIVVDSQDETGQMLQALKDMNESLLSIVSQVSAGTETIASASAQIAAGNLDLSSRTESQASSLEETASSMEELTATVKHNADNAKQANQLAISASVVAVQGGKVVSQVVDTMTSINASSQKIVDIIGVIDGIAFQTNILALNAAVEAARAGEQGRGFAVVASEVRNLAQRSAAAAKEIKVLINDSVNKVSLGSNLVNQAGVTMDQIVNSIKNVTDIIAEINTASVEQTSGIEQINRAITQMDEVTQQNAALVEQAAATAGALQDQASQLAQLVSTFKTNENTTEMQDGLVALTRNKNKHVPNAEILTLPINSRVQIRSATEAK